MFPKQNTVCTSQPSTNILPIDPTPLLENGNSLTAIIIAVAFLLWVLRPVLTRVTEAKFNSRKSQDSDEDKSL